MNDRDRLKKLFDDFGIGYKETENGLIQCYQGDNKIAGYSWFFTVFSFDGDGKFTEMGAYE